NPHWGNRRHSPLSGRSLRRSDRPESGASCGTRTGVIGDIRLKGKRSFMHSLTVLYPNHEGAKFDFEYYMQKHIPMANRLLGHEFKVTKGIASAQGGQPAFVC